MKKKEKDKLSDNLPACAAEFIKLVIKKMRYHKKVRADVMAELIAHFEDELKECATDEKKEQKARQLIAEFGDVTLLGVLLRRAKKRCRPLWRTIVARTFQTVSVLILCLIIYTVWFLTGKPSISVDYLAMLNQMGRPQVADVDNAWPRYEKAIELLVEPNENLKKMTAFKNYGEAKYQRFGHLTETEQTEIRKWVRQNEPAWQEFVVGSLKTYCYREYEYGDKDEEKWLLSVRLLHLRPLRYLAKAGVWRARMEMEQGRIDQALQDCLVVIRAGSHLQASIGTIIEQLVGLAFSILGCDEILNIAATKDLSTSDLRQLQQELLQIYPQGYPVLDIRGERLMLLDVLQHTFTDGGPGGGHLIPKRWAYLRDAANSGFIEDSSEENAFMAIAHTAVSMVHVRRDKAIAKVNETYELQTEIIKFSPYQKRMRSINSENMLSALLGRRYLLLWILMPNFDRASEVAYQAKALHEATVAVLGILRCEKERGKYPEKLNELVTAVYLEELPMDPYSDNPLVYKKTRDDDFVLYSVGPNFTDDGGVLSRDKKGKLKLWVDESDAVFWPVSKK